MKIFDFNNNQQTLKKDKNKVKQEYENIKYFEK